MATWTWPAPSAPYHEVGYEGTIMPDHVPTIEGDPSHLQAFSYGFGYLQALLQAVERG